VPNVHVDLSGSAENFYYSGNMALPGFMPGTVFSVDQFQEANGLPYAQG